MNRSLNRYARRAPGGIIVAAMLLTLMAGSVSAATQVSQTGSIGHTTFKDTSSKPGATCNYSGAAGTLYFDGMTLRAIKVEYPDQNSSVVESGKVGYVIKLQHGSDNVFTTMVTSPQVKITAKDNAFSKFPVRTQNWMGAATGGQWRAEVVLTWYNSDNSVKGKGTWVIDNYTRVNGATGSSCQGKHHNV